MVNKFSRKDILTIQLASVAAILLIIIICCVVLFVQADRKANEARLLDRAVLESASIAETLKSSQGDLNSAGIMMREHPLFDVSDDTLTLYYDEDLRPSSQTAGPYKATIKKSASSGYISYDIKIVKTDTKDKLYTLSFKAAGGGN